MKFIIATNNQKKLAELRDILTELGVYAVSLMDAGISSEVEETGSTFEENARLKAQAAMDILGIPAIADDSGLVVDALGGEPGIYSARYGGELLKNDTERCDFLRGKMTDVEDGARTARFVSAVACLFPDGREIITRGECEGTILRAPQGDGGFGYDPIFFVPSEGKTMAQISKERKNEISHRALALAKLKVELSKIL
ncbi:MAG: XTP/dITP diphosphatase [Clostridia bacterium]